MAAPGTAEFVAAQSEPGWRARVRLLATEFAPTAVAGFTASPLGADARLISTEIGGAPVEPRVLLAEGAWRVASGSSANFLAASEFGRTRAIDAFDAALPAGTTLRLEWRASDALHARALRLDLARASADASGAELALVFEGEAELDHDADPATPALRTLRRESLLLEQLVRLDDAESAQCALPCAFPGGEAQGLVLEVQVTRADDELARAQALERCRNSERGALVSLRSLHEADVQRAELQPLVDALARPASSRSALVELATRTGAELSADLALCAIDTELAALAVAAMNSLSAPVELSGDTRELGWRLERGTLSWLAARKDASALPYEFEGVLLRRTGELGRSAAALADVAATCESLAGFAQRLRDENAIFLDDHAAAARVRAYDWLAARGWAPAGYDPLADTAARRAALEAAAKTESKP